MERDAGGTDAPRAVGGCGDVLDAASCTGGRAQPPESLATLDLGKWSAFSSRRSPPINTRLWGNSQARKTREIAAAARGAKLVVLSTAAQR